MKRIAIIGAGISGLTLANKLKKVAEIKVFEKARGVSGRMSTRYADPYRFDHGAQYFIARKKSFNKFLKPHIESGLVVPWQPRVMTLAKNQKPYKRDWFEPHYIACPQMNSLCQKLAADLDVVVQTRVSQITATPKGWQLTLLNEATSELKVTNETFDWVLSSAPAIQTKALFPTDFAKARWLEKVEMTCCFSLMIGYDAPLPFTWQAAVVKNSAINWVAIDSDKPQRKNQTSILIQTDNEWSTAHIDDDREKTKADLLAEAIEILGLNKESINHVALHGWRYSALKTPAGKHYLLDTHHQLAAFGDWCLAGRVEGAFISANKLAKKMKRLFVPSGDIKSK